MGPGAKIVVGWARKHEQSKKIGAVKEFCCEIVLYLVKKRSYTTFYTLTSEFLGVKIEIFSEKHLIQKFRSATVDACERIVTFSMHSTFLSNAHEFELMPSSVDTYYLNSKKFPF